MTSRCSKLLLSVATAANVVLIGIALAASPADAAPRRMLLNEGCRSDKCCTGYTNPYVVGGERLTWECTTDADCGQLGPCGTPIPSPALGVGGDGSLKDPAEGDASGECNTNQRDQSEQPDQVLTNFTDLQNARQSIKTENAVLENDISLLQENLGLISKTRTCSKWKANDNLPAQVDYNEIWYELWVLEHTRYTGCTVPWKVLETAKAPDAIAGNCDGINSCPEYEAYNTLLRQWNEDDKLSTAALRTVKAQLQSTRSTMCKALKYAREG